MTDIESAGRGRISSRLGFILLSAGCAIGLGNVWRFPYIVGSYGGAAFVAIYIICLLLLGIPVLLLELAIGRSTQKSAVKAFDTLEKPTAKWHILKYLMFLGPYFLMSFYTVITGWLLYYLFSFATGDFIGSGTFVSELAKNNVSEIFSSLISDPWLNVLLTWIVIFIGIFVCIFGVHHGVERCTKPILICLLFLLIGMTFYVLTLDGAWKGVVYYLKPDFGKMQETGIIKVIWAALNQAFFTLSVGQGAIMIFGSYINKKHSLVSEALWITGLDTFVAFLSGLIIFPSCISLGITPDAGPTLLFQTMLSVFSGMEYGHFFGALFFMFMFFAAFSTVITVFESAIANFMEMFEMNRLKASIINTVIFLVTALPCCFCFSYLSDFNIPTIGNVMNFEDFMESTNILPLGSLGMVLFMAIGWGYNNFRNEVNTGTGLKLPRWLKFYFNIVLPLIIAIVFILGYCDKFL